jgi:alcohol dehydrogenase class IV
MWSEKALELLSRSFRTALKDGENLDAWMDTAMAATFAGMGFGNAGVHIPHANAHPIAGRVATATRRTNPSCRMAFPSR